MRERPGLVAAFADRTAKDSDEGWGPMANGYLRGAVVEAVVVRHRPFGMMVEMPNGEVGLLEPEYAEPVVWRDADGWHPAGTRLRVVVLGYTTPGEFRPAQLRLASDPNIVDAVGNS